MLFLAVSSSTLVFLGSFLDSPSPTNREKENDVSKGKRKNPSQFNEVMVGGGSIRLRLSNCWMIVGELMEANARGEWMH